MPPGTGKLVLWDVDLTLVQMGPVGRELYAAAFEQATGCPLRSRRPEMAGRLEPEIFREAVRAHDLDPAAHPFARFAEALAAAYAARSGELRERGRALPGAEAALAALAGTPVVQTVLTGNVRPVAIVKLAAFGLDRYLDLEVGAYGSDDHRRANLVGVAQQRAGARHGVTFDAAVTVVIGDTPHDVAAGREGGALVVAVATGRSSEAVLREAGADVVLPDLTDTAALLTAVVAGRR
jgi:phosphoglycolate phosphatase-like HAD superfamily hydrolase